nr:Fc receptor-like protein 5 [Maylandia zebra]
MGHSLLCLLGLFLLSTVNHGNTEVPSKPTVVLQPPWTQIYSGETVTVRCEIQGGEGAQWTYDWRAAKLNTPPTSNEYRIIRATESDSGGYSCRGRRDYFFSEWSDIITLTVSSKPKPTLSADNTTLPLGGSVTLTCSVNPSSSSSGWIYFWYRDNILLNFSSSDGQLSVSQEGLYSCKAKRGNPAYYTEGSQEVQINKTRPASAVVTVQPDWPTLYSGEMITLSCEIQGGDTEWEYEWRTTSSHKPSNQSELRVDSASPSNNGHYKCRGRSKIAQDHLTEWSVPLNLIVSHNKPRPVLTVSPSWLSPGASVTLNCEVEHPSAGWSFYWYKAVPDLSEKSSSYELLPDGSGTAQDSYIIHGQTHTAGYVCRAGRGDPEYHTDHSQPKFVWSADVHSAASLTVSPDRVQHFTSDSVSLTCEGNFTEWRVRKFSEKGFFSHCCDCQKLSGSSYEIHSLQEGVTVYWCESGSGEFSNAVNITVRETLGFGSEIGSFIVPFIIGLVSGIILVMLLLCCCRKIKDLCCNSLTQSQSTNQNSAAQQKANKNENNVYSSLLPGDFPVYEIITSSGNTGSGGKADEHRNVTSTLELKVIDEKTEFRKWRNDDPDVSSDYEDDDHETGSVSGS